MRKTTDKLHFPLPIGQRNKIPDLYTMEEISKLKEYLIKQGNLSEEEYLQAEDYALTRKISLERSLVFLNLLNYSELGCALAELSAKVYHPLLGSAPPDAAKSYVPVKYADKWKIFPVNFNSKEALLTLACAEPDNPALISKLKAVFPPSLRLDFTIATDGEIERAIDVYYRSMPHKEDIALELPRDFKIMFTTEDSAAAFTLDSARVKETKVILVEPDIKRAGALKTLLKGEGYTDVHWVASPEELPQALKEQSFGRLIINGRSYPATGSWISALPASIHLPRASYYDPAMIVAGQHYPYQSMSESLVALAAAFVRKNFDHAPHLAQQILARVRYCKLLALKLDLFQTQIDGVVLAAWLSAFAKEKNLLKQIATPFKLEEIIYPHTGENGNSRVEAAILKLVTHYQALKRKDPRVCENLDRLRRILIKNLPPTGFETYLEPFLNLIKNEVFLQDIDKPAGCILMVDPSLSAASPPAIRLNNDGFMVEVIPDADRALKRIAEHKYDLVISEIKLPDTDGLRFCRIIRSSNSTAGMPFFIFTGEENERLPIESLEAGADDFIKKSDDLEILSLKVQKAIVRANPQETKGGVSGSLQEMSATDFIQSLSAGEKSVKITIETEALNGDIYIENGNIIHARAGDLEGENAFYKIVVWEEGRFQISPCATFPPQTIQGNALSLLLEASRLADEAREGDDNPE